MDDLLSRLRTVRPEFGVVPTLLVAGNAADAGTSAAALAIGRAATAAGRRVLLIEDAGTKAGLAAAADADAEPIVVDLFGTLRVALKADSCGGDLYLAPSFEQGKRIASALVANRETRLVDDLAEAFDLLIVDAGQAGGRAAASWTPDILVRAGTNVSAHEDARLAESLDLPCERVIGTFLASRFVAATEAREPREEEESMPAFEAVRAQSPQRGRTVRAAQPTRAAPARATPPRRKIGAR